MQAKNYHTIDPLILETLNLNEKRISHLFDIIHSRDPEPYPLPRIRPNYKLPQIVHDYNRSKNPRQLTQLSHKRAASVSMMNSPFNSILAENEETLDRNHFALSKMQAEHLNLHKKKKINGNTPQKNLTIQMHKQKQKLYAQNMKTGKKRSMDLHPKDVYRIQIENLVSQLANIDQLQESEKLMKRLKRRYQHLRKFDKRYYQHLNRNDLLAI